MQKDNRISEYEEVEEEVEEQSEGEAEEYEEEEPVDYPESSVIIDYEDEPVIDKTQSPQRQQTVVNNDYSKMEFDCNKYGLPKDELISLLLQSEVIEDPDKDKLKGKKKFKNIQSHYNSEKLKELNNERVVLPSRDNPEYTNDFNTACIKVFAKMSSEDGNKDLLNILVADKDLLKSEIGKLDNNRNYIESKLNNYYLQKQKKIDTIVERQNAEFEKQYKFAPELLKDNGEKRNLEQFLKDQDSHIKKIEDKLKRFRDSSIELPANHPKVDPNSQKIYESKFKTEEPTYMRLYNKKNKENKEDKKEKVETKKVKKVDKKKNEEYIQTLYQKAIEKQMKIEELKEKVLTEEKKAFESYFESNKFLLNNITRKFNEVTEGMEQNITPEQLFGIMNALGFTTLESTEISEKQVLKSQEKKLILDIINEIKREDNSILKDNLFLFILSILNCYKYYQYSKKKGKNKEDLENIGKELVSKIQSHSKYGGLDKEGNFIIPFDKEKLINKDFKIFYINYSNTTAFTAKKINQQKFKEPDPTFKPTINPNSEKLCSDYRRKIIPETSKDVQIQNQIDYFDRVVMKMNYKKK
jgi:hypothetical protein